MVAQMVEGSWGRGRGQGPEDSCVTLYPPEQYIIDRQWNKPQDGTSVAYHGNHPCQQSH